MKFFKILMVMGVLAFGTVANAAVVTQETLVIDFGTGIGTGGTIEYALDGVNVIGTDIFIGALNVDGAVQGDGGYTANALLNFDTAANTITVVGTVMSLGITETTTLLTGNFGIDGWSFDDSNPYVEVFTGGGRDTKADSLLNALGAPLSTEFEFFAFSLESANGVVVSTDIVNTATETRTPEVPVPAAVWLFGSGLLGMIGVARRKA